MTAGQKCLCSSSIAVVLLKYCSDNNTTCKAGAGIVGNGGKVEPTCAFVSDHCNLKPDPGPCRAAFPKFYYDRDSFSCKSFIYGGCRGNANQFDTPEACMASCSGDGKET